MDIKKIQKKLNKIQLLTDNLQDQDHISSIEKDLLKDYIRSLYEEVLTLNDSNDEKISIIEEPVKFKAEEKYTPAPEIKADPQPIPVAEIIEVAAPQKMEIETAVSFDNLMANPSPESTLEQVSSIRITDPDSGQQLKYEQVQTMTQDGTISLSKNMEMIFADERVVELSDKLSRTKVDDILKTMGINERMFTVAELFGNNHSEFMDTVMQLNTAQNFDEARTMLTNGVASKYKWDTDERWKKAQQFVKNVRRKFVV